MKNNFLKLSFLIMSALLSNSMDTYSANLPEDDAKPKNVCKTQSSKFIYEKDIPWEPAEKGVTRQILGYNGQIMMVKVKFEKAQSEVHIHTTILRLLMWQAENLNLQSMEKRKL